MQQKIVAILLLTNLERSQLKCPSSMSLISVRRLKSYELIRESHALLYTFPSLNTDSVVVS